MKWFNFIIYVQLFLGAISLIYQGYKTMQGSHYINERGQNVSIAVYTIYPELRPIDVVFGICMIALAIFAIYIRFQLAGFKAKGPKLYIIYLGVQIVVSVIYVTLASSIAGIFAGDSSTITTIVTSIILIIANITYFKNRAHLFTN